MHCDQYNITELRKCAWRSRLPGGQVPQDVLKDVGLWFTAS